MYKDNAVRTADNRRRWRPSWEWNKFITGPVIPSPSIITTRTESDQTTDWICDLYDITTIGLVKEMGNTRREQYLIPWAWLKCDTQLVMGADWMGKRVEGKGKTRKELPMYKVWNSNITGGSEKEYARGEHLHGSQNAKTTAIIGGGFSNSSTVSWSDTNRESRERSGLIARDNVKIWIQFDDRKNRSSYTGTRNGSNVVLTRAKLETNSNKTQTSCPSETYRGLRSSRSQLIGQINSWQYYNELIPIINVDVSTSVNQPRLNEARNDLPTGSIIKYLSRFLA